MSPNPDPILPRSVDDPDNSARLREEAWNRVSAEERSQTPVDTADVGPAISGTAFEAPLPEIIFGDLPSVRVEPPGSQEEPSSDPGSPKQHPFTPVTVYGGPPLEGFTGVPNPADVGKNSPALSISSASPTTPPEDSTDSTPPGPEILGSGS